MKLVIVSTPRGDDSWARDQFYAAGTTGRPPEPNCSVVKAVKVENSTTGTAEAEIRKALARQQIETIKRIAPRPRWVFPHAAQAVARMNRKERRRIETIARRDGRP